MADNNQTLATIGLILGIVGMATTFLLSIWLGVMICIGGIVTSAMALGDTKARWGLGLSIATIVITIVVLALWG
jgi:hypothetical protein